MSLSILLIEDDHAFVKLIVRFLTKESHEVKHAISGEEGLKLFQEKTPDLVLLDMILPGMDGLETLRKLKKIDASIAVIVMTAHGSIGTAVESIRMGAQDYIIKPIDLEALSIKLDQARQYLDMKNDLGYVVDRERRNADFENFIGSCSAMCDVYDKIKEVSKTDNTTVLITGQSGTGKELVARAIHSLSERGNKPLMQIDCTTISLTLLESELFGHERGAFTGANHQKKGLLELADRGTLLLDEIGDMDLMLQSKLLRVLQERQFRRVGGTRNLRFDVRVIAVTNQDLDHLCEEGSFRRDLLYRLKVFQIELPPLSERDNDIIEIADAFVLKHARSLRKRVVGLDNESKAALMKYSFPGNVRELQNIIEQAVILTKSDMVTRDLLSIPDSVDDIPSYINSDSQASLSLEALGNKPLETAERELISQALKKSNGNKKLAAGYLGISRFTLQRKLEKFEIDWREL